MIHSDDQNQSVPHAKAYVSDHLGSVLNTRAAGKARVFGAFGERVESEELEISGESHPVVYGFAGRQLDPESGFYYNRARMYAPEIGRFTSKDPIGFSGGDFNLYRYTKNNALALIDPAGRCFLSPTEGAGHPYGTGPVYYAGYGGTIDVGPSSQVGSGYSYSLYYGYAYDATTGVTYPYTSIGTGDQASGAYAGFGPTVGYYPGGLDTFYGTTTGNTNVGAGVVVDSFDYTDTSSGGGSTTVPIPVIAPGGGYGGGTETVTTYPGFVSPDQGGGDSGYDSGE